MVPLLLINNIISYFIFKARRSNATYAPTHQMQIVLDQVFLVPIRKIVLLAWILVIRPEDPMTVGMIYR